MTSRERRWHELTRNTRFVLFVAGCVALVSVLWVRWRHGEDRFPFDPGSMLSQTKSVGDDNPLPLPKDVRHLVDQFDAAQLWAEKLRDAMALPANQRREGDIGSLEDATLDDDAKRLLGYWKDALFARDPASSLAAWQQAAEEASTMPYAAEWWADWLTHGERYGEAIRFYLVEARSHSSARAAERAVELGRHHLPPPELKALLDDPAVAPVDVQDRVNARASCGDYPGLVRDVFLSQFLSRERSSPMALFTALTIWLLILAKMGGWPRRDWPWIIPGLLAGALSTTVTLVVFSLQEVNGVLSHGENPLADAYYYIAGVGLREETSKLVLFLALVPLLWRGGSDRKALMVASLVGLGFATEENVGYFGNWARGAFPRLITANFLHVGLTGLLGLSMWRLLRGARHGFEHFLATFVGVVLAHGIYDYPWNHWMPASGLTVVGTVILCVVAYRYFDAVDAVAEDRRPIVSPTAVFVIGSAVLVGIAFNNVAADMGFRLGSIAVVPEFLNTLPLAFLFIRQFRHV